MLDDRGETVVETSDDDRNDDGDEDDEPHVDDGRAGARPDDVRKLGADVLEVGDE